MTGDDGEAAALPLVKQVRARRLEELGLSPGEVEARLGAPAGEAPAPPPSSLSPARLDDRTHRLVLAQSGGIGGFRGQLQRVAGGSLPRTLLITSGLAGEGKTTVAMALAASLAAGGSDPVVLVDAHLQAPMLHEHFQVPQAPGLAEVLRGTVTATAAVRHTDLPRVDLITAGGGGGGDVGRLLEADSFKGALDLLRARYGWVVVDGPALLSSPEALLIVPHFDGVAQVVRCEHTKKDVPDMVRRRVEAGGGNFLGVVLNRRKAYLPRFLYGRI